MKKTIVAAMLTAVMMTSFGAQVSAAVIENEGQEWAVSEDKTAQTTNVQVGANVDSTFKVYIPKKVTLAKADDNIHYEANYNVRVEDADIRPDQSLDISVPQTITMTEETLGEAGAQTIKNVKVAEDGAISSINKVSVGMDTAEATFNFKACEMNDDLTAYVDTDTVFTAGSWSGIGNFTITLASNNASNN